MSAPCSKETGLGVTKKQIWHKIESLGLQIKKVEQRKLPNRTKHNRHFFDTIDSKEKAYVLGLWVGDGWINKKDYQVGFCNNELELVELLKTLLESEHKINKRKQKVNTNSRLIIGSKILHSGLINLGFDTDKSHTAKYPDIPKELDSHFIRGVFDGDGSISRDFRKKDNIPNLTISIGGTFELMTSINTKIPENTPKIYKEKTHLNEVRSQKSEVRSCFCSWGFIAPLEVRR